MCLRGIIYLGSRQILGNFSFFFITSLDFSEVPVLSHNRHTIRWFSLQLIKTLIFFDTSVGFSKHNLVRPPNDVIRKESVNANE